MSHCGGLVVLELQAGIRKVLSLITPKPLKPKYKTIICQYNDNQFLEDETEQKFLK